MKKIGIVTIFGGENYGNKLQNYAMQEFLRQNGFTVETIQYTVHFQPRYANKFRKIKELYAKYTLGGFIECCWNIKKFISQKTHNKDLELRKQNRLKKIEQFQKENIVLSKNTYKNEEELMECNSVYDYVIAGSDQIWNPYWQGQVDAFFLRFVQKEKRIAYGPSIGVSAIPETQNSRYTELLHGFDKLSCRESSGVELIENLTNKSCIHVVDPVFFLTATQWGKLKKPTKVNEKYLLTYFLGGQSWKTSAAIKKIAKRYSLKIIDMYDEASTHSIFAGVDEFLGLIANAELFFTDSFHGCAFSIIFQTPFYVCERKSIHKSQDMTSRMDSILSILELTDRKFVDEVHCSQNVDFTRTEGILMAWREKSMNYLLSQLV